MMIYLLVFKQWFSIAMLNNQRVYVQPIFGKMGKSCVAQRIVCGGVKPMKYSEGKWIIRLVVAPLPVYSLGKWGFQKQHMLI